MGRGGGLQPGRLEGGGGGEGATGGHGGQDLWGGQGKVRGRVGGGFRGERGPGGVEDVR